MRVALHLDERGSIMYRRVLFPLLIAGMVTAPVLVSTTPVGAARATTHRAARTMTADVSFTPHNAAAPTVDSPDPFIIKSGSNFFAFSTAGNHKKCDGTYANMWVPHRSTTALGVWGSNPCFADVMPGGVGAWAGGAGAHFYDTWAPTVAQSPSTGIFNLYYTAKVNGTGQHCLGRATSSSVTGPYAPNAGVFHCPTGGFWAMDPNVFREAGHLYLQWRQDYNPGTGTRSRIYSQELSADGSSRIGSARTLLESSDMTWDGPVPGTSQYVIENPSIIHWGNTNQYYLSFSGDYINNNYATGMAVCGFSLTSGGKCVLQAPASKAFWGWSGRSHGGRLKSTPGDLRGPGGMAFVTLATGGFVGVADHGYVALHYNPSTCTPPAPPYGCPVRPMVVFGISLVDTSPNLYNF
jgi:hypothetical protein